MVTISSKIPGIDIWTYDFARRPVTTLDNNGNPQVIGLNKTDPQNDIIYPVTQNPTEFLDKPVNIFRLICDIHHAFNGSNIQSHGIIATGATAINEQLSSFDYYSSLLYSNYKFADDDVYISATTTATRDESYSAFTTKTPGIKLVYQTGIIQHNRGRSTIIFEVEPGYKIPSDSTITINPTVQDDFSGQVVNGNPKTFTLAYDVTPGIYMVTAYSDEEHDWINANIDFNTIQDTSTLPHSNVTFKLSHCTVSPKETNVVNGTHTWTFTAENGYVFNNNGGIENPNTGIVGDEIKATHTNVAKLENYDVENDTIISLSASRQQDPTIPFIQKLTHATSNVSSSSISRKLNAINLTADQGYIFKTAIQILFYAGNKVVSEYNVDGNNKDIITIPLNTTKENTITDNMDDVQLTATATKNDTGTGYEHNYLVTDTELNALSNEQIWNYVGGDTNEEHYNVSAYINNLIQLPFKVDTQTSVEQISLGRVKAHTVSHEAKSKIINLDLGVVNVPKKYNNAYDYQTQSIKLYTPFVAPITIDPVNAINKAIHIVYNVDLSNGNLTINLYNDNVLFFTGTNNIGSQLPFLNTLKNTIINRDSHFNDNDVKQPYIVVTRETPILNSDYYPTIERGLIKNYNGNVKVRLLNNMNIPNNELAQLTNKLESGVKYVKSN